MTPSLNLILAAVLWSAPQTADDELRARAERLHREALVLDTHADRRVMAEVERTAKRFSGRR